MFLRFVIAHFMCRSITSSHVKKIFVNKPLYCDLRGRIKGNAQLLYHVMNVGHVSVQYQHTRAINKSSILHGGDHLLESNVEKTKTAGTL